LESAGAKSKCSLFLLGDDICGSASLASISKCCTYAMTSLMILENLVRLASLKIFANLASLTSLARVGCFIYIICFFVHKTTYLAKLALVHLGT